MWLSQHLPRALFPVTLNATFRIESTSRHMTVPSLFICFDHFYKLWRIQGVKESKILTWFCVWSIWLSCVTSNYIHPTFWLYLVIRTSIYIYIAKLHHYINVPLAHLSNVGISSSYIRMIRLHYVMLSSCSYIATRWQSCWKCCFFWSRFK